MGTAGGLLLGALLGWVPVKASEGTGDTAFVFAPPPLRLLVVALVGRAARLDVLRAIATE